MTRKEEIFSTARVLFARSGYDGLRMRLLASQVRLPLSVLYHYYPTKDALLEEIYKQTNHELGEARKQLPPLKSAEELLRQIIAFQFEHAEQVVAVLKYYLHFRQLFPKNEHGFLPEKSALHIEEVLQKGIDQGEFKIKDMLGDAKIIAHAINGFLLEYYPSAVGEEDLAKLVEEISQFILRGLGVVPH